MLGLKILAVLGIVYVMTGCWLVIEREPRDDAEALFGVFLWPVYRPGRRR